ncbi:FadR/GntR family transcriptional regulator [Halalkalibacillus halophilus]|uniref:FadR/GntR family transcriptional regulator n=1 Tax=Halalkalibacillus halophilus TaxID=392827 RepID=UPI0003F74E08|nr:GntR family transcriptional regulator [Halalkalibacillus halophilus]
MTNQAKLKVYQEVLTQIREFIEVNELQDGDRLPSERELSEQLNAARSSVREALRAIELLGLIETKHGEGTFLRTYRPYHSVELLSTFVLREVRTKEELLDVKFMLEKQCLEQVNIEEVADAFQWRSVKPEERHTAFFLPMFEAINNQLLLKIWHLVEGFSNTQLVAIQEKTYYEQLYSYIHNDERDQAIKLHASSY